MSRSEELSSTEWKLGRPKPMIIRVFNIFKGKDSCFRAFSPPPSHLEPLGINLSLSLHYLSFSVLLSPLLDAFGGILMKLEDQESLFGSKEFCFKFGFIKVTPFLDYYEYKVHILLFISLNLFICGFWHFWSILWVILELSRLQHILISLECFLDLMD